MTTVTLSERAQAIVDKQVESGQYGGAQEVIEAALALLQSEDEAYWAMVNAKVEEGLTAVDEGRVHVLDDNTLARIRRLAREERTASGS